MKKTFTIVSFVLLFIASLAFAYCAACFGATLDLMSRNDWSGIASVLTFVVFLLAGAISVGTAIVSIVFCILNYKKAGNHPTICFIPFGFDATMITLIVVGVLFFFLRQA